MELFSRSIENNYLYLHVEKLIDIKEKDLCINVKLLNLTERISSININEIEFGVLGLTAIMINVFYKSKSLKINILVL
jgi:hypothetical protein